MRTPASIARTLRSLAHRVVATDDRTAATERAVGELHARVAELRGAVDAAGADSRFAVRSAGLRGAQLRVVLLVHNTSAWDSLHDLFSLLAGSAHVDVVVISIGKHFGGTGELRGEEDTHRELTSRGVPHLRCGPDRDPLALLRTLAPDVLFRQSQWDDDVDHRLRAGNLTFTRTCLVPYEMVNLIHNVGLPGTADSAVDLDYHHEAWLVFGPAATVAAARRSGRLAGRQFREVGHPKLDVLAAAEPAWPLPGRLPRVLLSTHHTVSDDWTSFGLLDELRHDALAWAAEGAGAGGEGAADGAAEIVWSPHPYLVPFVESGRSRLAAEDLTAWRAAWDALPTTATALDDSYMQLIAGSDVVVTDGLSMLVEAQVVGRPVVFLERTGHVPFNDAGEVALRGVHRVTTFARARELALELVRDGDPLREQQREVVRELFGEPGASRRILETLLAQARLEGWRGDA